MTTNVRTAVADRLGKSARLSLKEDVFGIYNNDNPLDQKARSLIIQMDLIKNKPLVRVLLVTVTGDSIITLDELKASGIYRPQRDLDNANEIYQRDCNAWVYCAGSITVNRLALTFLDQDDCDGDRHSVSDDEDELFDIGRNRGANIVCYYIWYSTVDAGGCAAHPPGRRGFWIGNFSRKSPGSPDVVFAHELTHIVGDNAHDTRPNNIMNQGPNKPVWFTLAADQVLRILNDQDMEYP